MEKTEVQKLIDDLRILIGNWVVREVGHADENKSGKMVYIEDDPQEVLDRCIDELTDIVDQHDY